MSFLRQTLIVSLSVAWDQQRGKGSTAQICFSLIILIKQPEITRCVFTSQAICLSLFQVSSFKFMERNDPVQPNHLAEPALQPGDQDHQNPLAAPGQNILGS